MTSRDEFIERTTALIQSLASDDLPPVVAFNKEYIITELTKMIAAARDGRLPPPAQRDIGLGRLVVDQWPPGTTWGTQLIQVENAFLRL